MRMTVNNQIFPLELKVKGVSNSLNFTVAIRSCVSETIGFFCNEGNILLSCWSDIMNEDYMYF